jgi:hypothetical protein
VLILDIAQASLQMVAKRPISVVELAEKSCLKPVTQCLSDRLSLTRYKRNAECWTGRSIFSCPSFSSQPQSIEGTHRTGLLHTSNLKCIVFPEKKRVMSGINRTIFTSYTLADVLVILKGPGSLNCRKPI